MSDFENVSYDEEVYVPFLRRVNVARFSSNKLEAMQEAAEAWGLTLPEDPKLAVKLLNLTRALLDGSKSLSSVSGLMLTTLGEALDVFPEGEDHHLTPAMIRDVIAPIFYQEEDICNLSESELRGARSELLREWSFRLGIDASQDDLELIEALLAYAAVSNADINKPAEPEQLRSTRMALFSGEPPSKKAKSGEDYHFFSSQDSLIIDQS